MENGIARLWNGRSRRNPVRSCRSMLFHCAARRDAVLRRYHDRSLLTCSLCRIHAEAQPTGDARRRHAGTGLLWYCHTNAPSGQWRRVWQVVPRHAAEQRISPYATAESAKATTTLTLSALTVLSRKNVSRLTCERQPFQTRFIGT